MRLPHPRGRLSAYVVDLLRGDPAGPRTAVAPDADGRDDAALSLWVLYELHYRGFDDARDRWEWDPGVLTIRLALEKDFESRLRADHSLAEVPRTADLVDDVLTVIESDAGRSLARHVQQRATRDETEVLLRQRSIYHLKEADPTSWVVPRLEARPKAALLAVQFDEYGNGDPARLHHALFQRGLTASGLSGQYGAYVDEALPEVLEQNNLMSLFGLHRRLRGAALGHLAAFEATSSVPSRQLAQGLRRLGFPDEMASYYDEHVEADAVHEQLALRVVCQTLVDDDPSLADDVRLGAWACLELEGRTAAALLDRWAA